MIRIAAFQSDGNVHYYNSIDEIYEEYEWIWYDFMNPAEEEVKLLDTYFSFHPLAIEDAVGELQRPKIDFYKDYYFVILHDLCEESFKASEIDLFVSEKYIVTVHQKSSKAIDELLLECKEPSQGKVVPIQFSHRIIDRIVDYYFLVVYEIEDKLNELEEEMGKFIQVKTMNSPNETMEKIYRTRSKVSRLRRTIVPMRELLYRMVNSQRLKHISDHRIYYKDIYDHLLKQSEMIDVIQELTSDLRDTYYSLNAQNMNKTMKGLAILSAFFLPLSFLAGVYGMNFKYMPYLKMENGFFVIAFFMGALVVIMYFWIKKKGWFD
ncbi:MAG: magnesium/cobalt transporter CorA [Bacillaceae bacterium]